MISIAKQQKLEIANVIDNSVVRNAIYRRFYEQIAYLQKLCSNNITQSYFTNSGSNLFAQMNAFAEKCELGECQIAVIGTVKAGKSAFINALIGREIASSYPTPETASITKFRKSEKGNYVKVSFYSSNEWQELWDSVHNTALEKIKEDEKQDFLSLYDLLKAEKIRTQYINKQDCTYFVKSIEELKSLIDKYTSARYPEHFFAKEVEVGLSDFFAPSNVVIVDTPGLDDPVPYRTDITRRYLHKANVILFCIRSNRAELPSPELKQLSYIFSELRYHKERIITIGTQIDEPRDMLNFWEKYTLPEYLKYLSRSTLYGSKEIAKKQTFPVSAFYYFYVQNAINNPSFLFGETNEEKRLRDQIGEIVQRYYECPNMDYLIHKYGREEAFKLYRSPLEIFNEHKNDLLEMTQIPKVRKMILGGPIKNANDIILSDIKDMYISLNNEIKKISEDVASHRKQTFEISQESDVRTRIELLERKLKEEKIIQQEQAKLLSKLLADLEIHSQNALNQIKN